MKKDRPPFLEGKKTACIINPSAANKKWRRRRLLRRYIKENLPGEIFDGQEDKAHTTLLAKKLSENNDVIIVAGGDGTIADVIQGVLESENQKNIVLGIIPLGSGNAFSKSLGIPKNVKRATQIIREGQAQEVDLLEIEGIRAAFGSIGASAQITKEKQNINIPGLWGHVYAAKIMPRLAQKEQEIELIDGLDDSGKPFDQMVLRLKALDCVVSKTKHFGYGWRIAPKAEIHDGYIDTVFFEISWLKYVLLFPLIYFGILQRTQRHYKAKKIIFHGKNLCIQYHGEILGTKDRIEVNVLPRALKIIMPKIKSMETAE
jgi:diacylglycerol kinase (ATP)